MYVVVYMHKHTHTHTHTHTTVKRWEASKKGHGHHRLHYWSLLFFLPFCTLLLTPFWYYILPPHYSSPRAQIVKKKIWSKASSKASSNTASFFVLSLFSLRKQGLSAPWEAGGGASKKERLWRIRAFSISGSTERQLGGALSQVY
jgi:hypothetical protein